MIYCGDPLIQYEIHKEEIDEAVQKVLTSGRYIDGHEVKYFEKEFAKYIGVGYGVGVGNGTNAIQLALMALDIGNGDEVITVSFTVSCTVSAIVSAGATPVLVDVDPYSYTIDVDEIKKLITKRTKAIIPVHMYGYPCNMTEIKSIAEEYNLRIVEDCAQAHGAVHRGELVGSMGDIGCFSFYPTKNLGCFGDGGIVVTDSHLLSSKLRSLKNVGWNEKYVSECNGINSRLDELQAAVLRVKLKYLDSDNYERRQIAKYYSSNILPRFIFPYEEKRNTKHIYHQYSLQCDTKSDRDRLLSHLIRSDIAAGVHYPIAIHQQPAYKNLTHGPLTCTSKLVDRVLSLPIYPGLQKIDIDNVVHAINTFTLGSKYYAA